MQYIYARTSTEQQDVDQQAAMLLEVYPDAEVHKEQASAKSLTDRPVLDSLLASLEEGDCLVIYDMSRLSRNTVDFLTLLEDLDERGVGLIIHSMGGQPVDSQTAVGKMILTVLSATATMERELMLEKQKIGIARAAAEGKYNGRPVNPKTELASKKAAELLGVINPATGKKYSKELAAKACGIGVATLYRYLRSNG